METPLNDPLNNLLKVLKNPIPQYVLCCLPVIAMIGNSPYERFAKRLRWLGTCLSCPFQGLLYVQCKNDEMVIFWLSKTDFVREDGKPVFYKPVGHFAMQIEEKDLKKLKDCIEAAPFLER
jgi:hypothetical protein